VPEAREGRTRSADLARNDSNKSSGTIPISWNMRARCHAITSASPGVARQICTANHTAIFGRRWQALRQSRSSPIRQRTDPPWWTCASTSSPRRSVREGRRRRSCPDSDTTRKGCGILECFKQSSLFPGAGSRSCAPSLHAPRSPARERSRIGLRVRGTGADYLFQRGIQPVPRICAIKPLITIAAANDQICSLQLSQFILDRSQREEA
jgi:hypothetical protein